MHGHLNVKIVYSLHQPLFRITPFLFVDIWFRADTEKRYEFWFCVFKHYTLR
jgi:uncharacterized membrane protein YbaN (DUF454 family)